MNDAMFALFVAREVEQTKEVNRMMRHYDYETYSREHSYVREYYALLQACAQRGHFEAIAEAMSWTTDETYDSDVDSRAAQAAVKRDHDMAFSVECPYCGAKPEAPCVIGNGHKNAGKPIESFHGNRFRHAQHIQYTNEPTRRTTSL
ncbi:MULTISPECIES: hypothetical protein [Arthrobacter]|uniref:DNA-binding phage zinc finger domain-containing protein n=1 Tax=Arthrobacter terricola TaxID=2547396 RepID=A0A4R5KPL4_9MICC|nr:MULTISPECIES: hypothetical protein [Arthrobacter]MBT8161014.1 hypothetical protein [Arthrobacter sp. GN70]TDF96878.1 hypothetical protein E1809_09145 [Arthrobacter terricola]